ncbi:MAG: DUF1294 domain-containing protein [Clostridiales bacterium]|nr:DUF1294 domain-containing protein [Clostridiales bacterium]
MKYLIIYIIIINLTGFITMAADKKRAMNRRWRIPESVLLTIAFIGGSLGSIAGLLICRHKTRHLKFTILLPLFLALHIFIALVILRII